MSTLARYATAVLTLAIAGGASLPAQADAPCGDLDECRVLIEINATDGDIGFHVLFDAEGWKQSRIRDPNGRVIHQSSAHGGLRDQSLTENFFESAEPVCEARLAEEPDETVVTLPEFLDRFPAGSYAFRLKLAGETGESSRLTGATTLTHGLPAAPADVEFDGSTISWTYGDDLGECTTWPPGFDVLAEADIAAYEVKLEPVDPALARFVFTTLVANGADAITVPVEYLASLPTNAGLKVEVIAIEQRPNGSFGNQTASEEDGFCNNVDQEQCPDVED